MAVEGGWSPQESLDVASRTAKATKIARLIEARRPLAGARVLEVGTGGGIISALLASRVRPGGRVWSVDVDDYRQVDDGYRFRLVTGTELPFGDSDFDVVVSNHTIEHVGGVRQQADHLREVARVLRPGGLAYLATPLRWAPIEPHFKVPFLSWLPPRARSPYLRISGRGRVYDIDLRTRPELIRLAREAGLQVEDVTVEGVRLIADLEHLHRWERAVTAVPAAILDRLRRALPTAILLLRR